MDYRIGITGAQGSGKTTLAKYIDKHYGIPYVDAGVGSLMSRLGVRVGDSMPLYERLQIQMEIAVKWFTEFGHLNRGDMLTSEQHRCHN
ncbi:dephospho-CoA kinase, partial [Escherichia coli]|uniref:AAA family ATPase n=1 Tax=Escherichia coli TaxID=562 RepID=UPI001CA3EE2D